MPTPERSEMGDPADPGRLLPATARPGNLRARAPSPASVAGNSLTTTTPIPSQGNLPPLPQTHLAGCSEAPSRGVTEVPASSSGHGLPVPQPLAPASGAKSAPACSLVLP